MPRPRVLPLLLLAAFALAACARGPAGPNPSAPPQPQTPAEYVAEGDRLLAESQWPEAEAAYRAALEKDPDHAPAWSHLAYLHLFNPVTRKAALDEARKATALAPQSAQAWAYLARAQDWNGDFDEARVSGEKAVQLNPKDADAQSFLGEVYTDLRLYAEAQRAAEEAVALDPSNAEAHRNLGYLYVEIGRKEDALREWQAAFDLQPRFAYRWITLAGYYRRVRPDPRLAESSIQGALALDPADVQALSMLADLRQDAGRDLSAKAACNRIQSVAPDTADAHGCLGNYYLNSGRVDEAGKAFERAIAVNPDDESGYLNLGYTYYVDNRCEAAVEQFRKAIELHLRSGSSRAALGLGLACTGDFAAAQQSYGEAVELEPYEGNHLLGLARLYLRQGDLQAAQAALAQAIQLDPEEPLYHYWMGQVSERQGKAGEAEAHYRQASELGPSVSLYPGALGAIYLSIGELDKAEAAFEEGASRLESFPTGDRRRAAEIYFGLGLTRAALDECQSAVEFLERSLFLNPSESLAQQALVRCRQQLGYSSAPLASTITSGGLLGEDAARLLLAQQLNNWGYSADVGYQDVAGGGRVLALGYLTAQEFGIPDFYDEQISIARAASAVAARVASPVLGAVVYAVDEQENQLNALIIRRDWALMWLAGALDDRAFASLWQEVR